MSIGETFSRLLLKRLIDDVFITGGVEALDSVIEFLTRCGEQDDPALTSALEHAMYRAWRALESALCGEPSKDHSQAGLAPRDAQALRQCLDRVLAELAHGGSISGGATVTVVANGLRRQCLDDLRSARAGRALSGCLDREEWARSNEVFVRFAAELRRPDTRRRTEGQLLRDLEQHGCVGLMRILTAGSGLPLLVMAARAFVCQELAHLLYRCLQEHPEQTPDNCTLVLGILHELSMPRFSVWRSPPVAATPVHWSRLESGSGRNSLARTRRRWSNDRSSKRRSGRKPSWNRLLLQTFDHFQHKPHTDTPRSSWTLASVLTVVVLLLVVAPIWLLVEDARRQNVEQQRVVAERQRLREERRRLETERQQLIETQQRIAREEIARQNELQSQRAEAERRRRLATEEKRRQAEERAAQRREEEHRRREKERQAQLREKQQRLERARVALEDGLRLAALGDDRKAETALSEALRLDPSLVQGWSARGKARRRLGDVLGALSDFHEAARRDPTDVRCWLQCGELHAERHEFRQAIDTFTVVLRLEPDNVAVYRQRGLAHSGNGQVDKALADQSKAIDLAPNDPWAYLYRANLQRQRGSLDAAFDDYTAAIDRDRGEQRGLAAAYQGRGMIFLHRHEYKQAIRDLTQAIDRDPSDFAAQQARGTAYLHRGDWNQALLDAEEVIQHKPDDSAAYKLRGQAYMGLRQYRRAHDDFTRALRKGRDAETFYLRARVKAHLGDINEAIYDCNDATALDPKLARAFYLRTRLYLHERYRPTRMFSRRIELTPDPIVPLP
ncbi:MAG TPA: tetratricopeptide repeat protein [Gemmataceae bacterium]|nr:tetratricopeptide repeat protein [Gemmataceae bacterium]